MKKKGKQTNIFYRFGIAISKARLLYFEGLNFYHLKIRKLHDISYSKGGRYKKWTDKPYSSKIHNATLMAFIISITFFSLTQFLAPSIFSPSKPLQAYAELPSERKPNIRVYQNSEGKKEYRVYGEQINYQDKNGNYQLIDTNITNLDENNFEVLKTPYNLRFQKDISKPIEFTPQISNQLDKDYKMKFALSDQLNKSNPTIENNKATYKNIYTNTNLERIAEPTGIKQNFIFKESGHPYEINEIIETKLNLREDINGSILVLDEGALLAQMPQPFIQDKNEVIKYLDYILVKTEKNKYSLKIKIPDLSSMTYPMILDPTIYNIQPNNYRLTTNNTVGIPLLSVRPLSGSTLTPNIYTIKYTTTTTVQYSTDGGIVWNGSNITVTTDSSTWNTITGTNLQVVFLTGQNIVDNKGTIKVELETSTKKDTYINSGATTTNYGTATTLSNSSTTRPLLHFDYSTLLNPGEGITSASLNLYQSSTTAVATTIYPLTTSGWTETGATWSKKDGTNTWASTTFGTGDYNTGYTSTLTTSASVNWQKFDITNITQAWQAGLLTNNGIVLTATTGTSTFYSSDYITNKSLIPYISITIGVTGDIAGGDLVVDGEQYTIYSDRQGVNGYKSITVKNGAVLNIQPTDTIDGSVIDVNVAGGTGDILVTGNSSIIPKGYYTGTGTAATNGKGVTLNAGNNIQIDTGSKIDASLQGYIGGGSSILGDGPGAGSCLLEGGNGGSYGGAGGRSLWCSGVPYGETYGSVYQPTDLGSGGSNRGGTGGGAIKVISNNSFINNGSLLANGGTNTYSGGSGGSIWIKTNIFSGNGILASKGGNETYRFSGGGGGGRVFIEFNSSTWSGSALTESNITTKGTSYNGGEDGTLSYPANDSILGFGNQKTISNTVLGTGATTNESGINLSFWYQSNSPGITNVFTPQIEIRSVDTAFTCTGTDICTIDNINTYQGSIIDTKNGVYLATVNIPSGKLTAGISYHWQASYLNSTGVQSSWSSYGGNNDNLPADIDFSAGETLINTSVYPDLAVTMTVALTNTQSGLTQKYNTFILNGGYNFTIGNSNDISVTNELKLSSNNTKFYTGTNTTLSSGSLFMTNGNTNVVSIGSGTFSVVSDITLNANHSILFSAEPATLNNTAISLEQSGAVLTFPSFTSLTNPIPVTTEININNGTLTLGNYSNISAKINRTATGNLTTGSYSVLENPLNTFTVPSTKTFTVGTGTSISGASLTVNGGTLSANVANVTISAPITYTDGTITLGTGAQLTSSSNSFNIPSSKTVTVGNGSTVNAGTFNVNGGTATLGSNTNPTTTPSTFNFYNDLLLSSGTLTFPSNSTINVSGDATVGDALTSTMTVGGNSTLNVPNGLLLVKNGSTLTPLGYYTISTSPSYNGRGLTINAKNVTVDAGSKIDASGQGYAGGTGTNGSGFGPGYAQSNSYFAGGGSYGGHGGYYSLYTGGDTYGVDKKPVDLGSGGAGSYSSGTGGKGGGAILLNTVNSVTNNGQIISNGANGAIYSTTRSGGGGSGGTVNVSTGSLLGNGVISAIGGNGLSVTTNQGSGGGGGRVSIVYGDKSQWTGTISYVAGTGRTPVAPINGSLYMPPGKPYNLSHENITETSIKWKWQQSEPTDSIGGFKFFAGDHVEGDESDTPLASINGGGC